MAKTGALLRDLPAELLADPAMTTMLGLAGDTPVLLVAGPDAEGVMTVSAVTETWMETLWPLAPGPAGTATGRVDLVATGDGRALALIPGQGLLCLDPLAEDETQRAQRLKPGRARLPDRLFAGGGGVTGLWLRSDGRTLLATLDATGARHPDSERAGPRLTPGQAVNLVLRDGAGRDLVMVEDHRTGFQIWRQDGAGGWKHLATDGAARHGLNVGVADGLLWGDRVVLAVGSTAAVRQALPGMPVKGELIALDTEGRLRLLSGELRISPGGLMVPELSAAAITMLNPGHFSHLAVDDAGRLIVTVVRRNGPAGLFAIAPDRTVTALADPCAAVLGLVPDPAVPGQIRAVLSR